jgi:predicted hotdog family 3-hydroxylacyl-ACP dehydratase
VTSDSRSFGPVADYLPHRPPMLLIDHIVEATDDRVVCRATIHPDCVFAIDGAVHPAAMIEWVAQACAICIGVVAARDHTPPRAGLIIACREISFGVDQLAVGDELTIVANKLFVQPQLATFTGTVQRGGALCATVQLSVADAEIGTARPTGAGG